MKTYTKKHLAVALLTGGVAMAMSGAAVSGIANTKHNLGSTSTTGNNQHSGTGEICVFCHTPHGSSTLDSDSNKVAVPLWNKALPSVGTFTTYDQLGTSSLDGAVVSVGSVSIACLSCHDGSQAMDNMVNKPGSGNVALTGTWSGAAQTSGKLNGAGVGFPNLGTDLQNDHPVGIQYAGGGCTSGGGACDTTDFKDKDFKAASYQNINTNDVWWVDVPTDSKVSGAAISVTAGTRDKSDMQLYTRNSEPFVECASCHDPHVENVTFLRIDNTGSKVCLACHTK